MHVPPEWRDYHASNIELILNGTESAGNAGMRVRLYDEERVVLALWRAVMSGEISAVEFIEIYSNAGDAVQAAGAAFAQKRARSNAIAIALSALPAFRLFPQSAVARNLTAGVARSALGKGQGAVPGAPLSASQRTALLKNRTDTIANVQRAIENQSLPPQLRERMFRIGMQRIETINQTLARGIVPPKH